MGAWPISLLGLLIAGAAQAAPAPAIDACALLTAAEIQAVQQVAVKETKPSTATVKTERVAQCVYATSDFAHSVSLTVVNGVGGAEATRAYWTRTFKQEQSTKKKRAPVRPVSGIGQDAFWTGDARAGALYVLSDGGVLRISVGGVADPDERVRRSTELAHAALRRLRG